VNDLEQYPPVMNEDEATEFLRMKSATSLKNACRAGIVPHIKLRNEYTFSKIALEEWLFNQSMQSVKEQEKSKVVSSIDKYCKRK
jgi:hypothetical protein